MRIVFLSSMSIFRVDVELFNMVSRKICSPLTGGPSGGRDSEMRGNLALIMCTSCSPSPYASFGGSGLL